MLVVLPTILIPNYTPWGRSENRAVWSQFLPSIIFKETAHTFPISGVFKASLSLNDFSFTLSMTLMQGVGRLHRAF